ncbi:MAG: hypothetical protein JW953_00930 [Anaerolineae bacterium]|nr:hypothetical protein [Anaerolineae bacterium]
MAKLIVFVIDETQHVEVVFETWLRLGVPGVTVINSAGLRHQIKKYGSRDDLPFVVSLQSILQSRKDPHQLIFSVVRDDFDVDTLVVETEKVTGPLNNPDVGILFVVPVQGVWGLRTDEK